ncbi:helix-turn-helix domain-containing protein [Nocardia sp. NBC_01730]|uniref:helix-turn-helix domain-containing protein n=1 Tax=Nocardia sp. NBC_01730 TaxID=2975998 RepID=UPI002E145DE5|nr:helix-turn-helix domain-containing protein [Nocardia sp. NBC_01730]
MGVAPHRFDPRETAEALFGAELRARRKAAGLSLRQLAPLLLVSHDLLARIEKAERRPQPDFIDRVDHVLGADGDLRQLAEPFTQVARQRTLPISLEPDSAEPSLRDLIADVRAADHTMAARQLDELVAHANAAEAVVSRVEEDERTPLLRAIAEAHQLSGWMLFDRGSVALAERSFTNARRIANRADALDLIAFVGGPNSSFMSTWCGDPAQGAEQAYASLSWARRSGNRRLTAFVTTMAARAHARMGEAALCKQMLDDAETELSRHRPDGPDPVWLEVFDDAALAGHRGSCLLALGQPRQAIESLREQDSTSPTVFVRNRTIWQLEQAEAQLRTGEHDVAAATVEQALDYVAVDSITPRVVRMFRSIDLKLRACGDPAVAATTDRLEVFIGACV